MSDQRPRFRGDIDGLRGVAILLVVLYHAGIGSISGGFAGVDVFFIISGYLITRNLLGEVESTGKVTLRAFWARRVRRLVPALSLVALVTVIGSAVILSPLELGRVGSEAVSSVLYVSNFVFARTQGNYFGNAVGESLFLHTWSLSVEEQFYLVWPVLIGVLAFVATRRRRSSFRPALVVILASGCVLSFAGSVLLTDRGSSWAFFSLPTRAWEFGLAGLLALAALEKRRLPQWLPTTLGVVGIALIVATAVGIDSATVFPGWAVLLPAAGALAVIAGGETGGAPVSRLLANPAAQWLGRLSYSWYLWHWPVMKLTVAAAGHDSTAWRLVGVTVALGLAVASYHLVERPIRFNRALVSSPIRTFVMGALTTAIVLASVVGLREVRTHGLTSDSFMAALNKVKSADNPFNWEADHCTPYARGVCQFGEVTSATTVLVVGDSHASHWVPALSTAGTRLHVRVVVARMGGCPSVDLEVAIDATTLVPRPGCTAFRAKMPALIATLNPAVIVLSNSSYLGRVFDRDGSIGSTSHQLDLWQRAFTSEITSLRATGAEVGVVLDSPDLGRDPIICVAREHKLRPCDVPRSVAMKQITPFHEVEQAALAKLGGDRTLDAAQLVCPDSSATCPVSIDGHYTFVDKDHVTASFALSKADDFEHFLNRLMVQR